MAFAEEIGDSREDGGANDRKEHDLDDRGVGSIAEQQAGADEPAGEGADGGRHGETDDSVGVSGCVAGDETEHESDEWPLDCAEAHKATSGVFGETRAKLGDRADGVDLCRVDDDEGLTVVTGEDELAVGDESRDRPVAPQQAETRSAEQAASKRSVAGPVLATLRDQKVRADKNSGTGPHNENDFP